VIRAFVQVAWEATAGVNPAGVHVDVLDGALAAVCTVVDGASLKKIQFYFWITITHTKVIKSDSNNS
jgi:hypothetical protein